MNKVAVYGSLLSDMHNHHVLGDSKLIGNGWVAGATLYSLGSYPGLKFEETLDRVKVEVYEVDDATLARLDRLEGHPTFYKREKAVVINDEGSEAISTDIYEWQGTPRATHRLVESGDWKAYYNEREKDR